MITFAWLFAVVGGLLACLLLSMESQGKKMPAWLPLKKYIWWLCILMFLGSVLWIMFSDI